MHKDALEKLYRELPTHHRDRWDFERFRTSAEGRVNADTTFVTSGLEPELHAKLPAAQKNEFGGLASAFGVKIDAWIPSYIEPGSFKHTLADASERSRVKVLYQHVEPIGVPTFLEETSKGLLVMGKVSNTSLGQDALTLMRDGVITEMSIGFDPVEYYFKEGEDKELYRHVTQCRLWEFSPVTFGANRGAKITVINALRTGEGDKLDLDALVERLTLAMAQKAPTASRIDEANHLAVRAEIERLQKLLPVQLEDLSPYHQRRAELEALARGA